MSVGFGRATWTMLGLLAAAVLVTLLLAIQIRTRAEQVADAFEAAPLVAIARFPATGYARVEGRVRLGVPALVAPLSDRRCAYYEIHVEVDGGKLAGASRPVSRGRDFWVEDDTGAALVYLRNAVVALDGAHCVRGVLADLPAIRRSALAREQDLGHIDGIDPARVRFRECALPAGARIAVAGTAFGGQASPSRVVIGDGQAPIYIGVAAGRSE